MDNVSEVSVESSLRMSAVTKCVANNGEFLEQHQRFCATTSTRNFIYINVNKIILSVGKMM